jgi:hypothetical protein
MDDPENWSHRGKPDKEKYKDNQRAEADANVISILSREIKKENPNALVITTIYPYLSYYSKAPHPVKTEMKKLVNLIKDKGILLSSSGKIKDRNLETLCPAVMYINKPYPWSYRLLFSSGGRFAENYYSGNDKDIYWFSRGNFTPAEPVIWAAAEYAWNVKAPGWGTAPNKKNNNIALADANPREITEELLPRICSILFGPQAAMLMAKIYAQNISCYLPVQISQFSGANPRNYFKSKSEAALNAIQWLREAEGKITPTAQKYFISVKNHIQLSYALSEARYRYFNSLKKLSNKNYAGAKLEIQKAVSVLGPVKEHKLAKELMKELNIDPLIEWYHEKNEYVKDIKPLNISCGVYSMDSKTYKGICDGLTNIPGLKIEVFNYPSQKVLADYDVIIFPGTKNIFQGSEIENWRKNIRDFVKRGGGVIFSHNAVGRYSFSDFGKPIFPEICAGYGGQVIDYDNPIFLSVATAHPSVECLRDGEKFKHEYFDHLWIEPGPKAVTILKNDSGNSVMCAGEVGEGRCVYTGEIFGINRKNNIMEPLGIEWKILFNMVRWSAGMNKKIDKGK